MPIPRLIAAIFAFTFCGAQTYFWCVGDSHMVTLMCGGVFLCIGIYFGWGLYDLMKRGDK